MSYHMESRTYGQWTWIFHWDFLGKGLNTALFLLIAYSKCQRKKENSRKKVVSKNKPGLHDLGNSQPLKLQKNSKLMRLTVRRMNSEYKAMGMAGQPLATTSKQSKVQHTLSQRSLKEHEHVTHGPTQPSQQKPQIKMGLSRKDVWRTLVYCHKSLWHGESCRLTRFEKYVPA